MNVGDINLLKVMKNDCKTILLVVVQLSMEKYHQDRAIKYLWYTKATIN